MSNPFREVQELADGKIKCECGNSDWRMFVYVGAISDYLAACKTCGRSYRLIGIEWTRKGGPFRV